MKRFTLIASLLIALSSVSAHAADKYVRKGASGSGSSWSDAYGELSNVSWSGMSGGTLWVAAGSYGTGFPDLSTSGVTIKRATTAAHGAATGWSDSYDGQVTVTPSSGNNFLVINTGATGTVVDGAGFSPWKFRVAGVRGYNGMLRNEGADNVIIRGLEIDGMGESTPSGGPEDGLRWMGGKNAVLEHNFVHDFRQVGGAHNDGIQGPSCTNITFQYNVFKNNGMHIFLGDYAWGSQSCNGISIHHNVFYNDANGGSYNSIVFKGTNSNNSYTNKIENNVFNLRGQGSAFYLADSPSPGCCNGLSNSFFRNNILYNSDEGNVNFYAHSYNLYYGQSGPSETGKVTADPQFVDVANNNYALKSTSPAIGAGTALGYVLDFLGNAVSGAVDMGAYSSKGTAPPATTIAPPTSLRILP